MDAQAALKCYGQQVLSTCTNICRSRSCWRYRHPNYLCTQECRTMCICRGNLYLDQCSNECVLSKFCPSKYQMEQCAQNPKQLEVIY